MKPSDARGSCLKQRVERIDLTSHLVILSGSEESLDHFCTDGTADKPRCFAPLNMTAPFMKWL
jgi:hypothetical protein